MKQARTFILLLFLALLCTSMLSTGLAVESKASQRSYRLIIRTLPPTKNYPILISGTVYLTNASGIVETNLPPGEYNFSIPDVFEINETVKAMFGRWFRSGGDRWEQNTTLRITRRTNLTLGLVYLFSVSMEFADGLGRRYPDEKVQEVHLLNSWGDHFHIRGRYKNIWLRWNYFKKLPVVGPRLVRVNYSVQSVRVEDLNVVNEGKYVFKIYPGAKWKMYLQIYPIRIHVVDAVFGTPSPGHVRLISDENGLDLLLDAPNGTAYIDQIPRGIYTMKFDGLAIPAKTVLTGPKVDYVYALGPATIVTAVSIVVFVSILFFLARKPKYKRVAISLLTLIVMIITVAFYVIPATQGTRFLSATATPIFAEDGRLIAFKVDVRNRYFAPIFKTYTSPDLKLFLYNGTHLLTITYESPDFHDMEIEERRTVYLRPGTYTYIIELNDALTVSGGKTLDPGEYDVSLRLFGITAHRFTIYLPRELDLNFTWSNGVGEGERVLGV